MALTESLLGCLDSYADHYTNSNAKLEGSISIGSGSGSAGTVDWDRLNLADYGWKAYEYSRQAQAQGMPLLESSRTEVKKPISFNQQLLLLEDV